ncbi:MULTISPECIES: Gfo/Idh/MocA family protein [Paenibacillus]|uniref:Gfo/Idh/MocA family protein n=1 Tax=Paenibacillus TaxID=44249 RepID=UPI000F5241FF|nr:MULTISPECIES: Gfo/Idh/MocA family oxidoreductase [Paenibacillus]KAA8755017.1 Gfo/Idh/MocA family oxidoreductase [Paenibacillus sp. UASWS1643]MDQ0660192.1 UDP-N-acetylglucosamine 3-dehydrogenase [Paenibacillus sp. W2I17]MDQ0724217.1 UDP-N-acetylglucosamine 3-dehydrogenase [Paenibacillus sp. W4I10]MDR6720623.1 putative dehydrogenase [Paenibacillus sp. 2003]RPK22176.1 Myo-inositol 2-dehydrogenase [Paenibacillus xylanexedens]
MSKIKVAVFGCGAIAERRHIPEYAANENVELVAFADPIVERAEKMAETYGGKAYSSYEELLANETVDAVSVCTPNYLHAPMAIAAANAGKHVLVEKPMAVSTEEGEQMIEAAKKNGVYLMVGHNQRLMPPHVKAKEILDSGKLGKVLNFRTSFGHPGPEGWSVDGAESWFFRKEEAIMGAMGDLGVHKSDFIRYLLNDEVSEVAGFISTLHKEGTKVDDNATCLLRMKSGAIGTLVASWTQYRAGDNSTVLWCENGVMKIGTVEGDEVIVELTNGTVETYKVGAMATNEKQVPSGVIDAFVESIVTQTPPAISGEEGLRSLQVILAAFESEKTGQIVKL